LPKEDSHNICSAGAESHADSNLRRAAADGERDDAVKANCGKYQRQAGE